MSVFSALAVAAVCLASLALVAYLRRGKKSVFTGRRRRALNRALTWANQNGFNDWGTDGYAIESFGRAYGSILRQPYPVSQFLVYRAAVNSGGTHTGDDFESNALQDVHKTGFLVGAALEHRLDPADVARVLTPVLREIEESTSTTAVKHDAAVLDRVADIIEILDTGGTLDAILEAYAAAPSIRVALTSVRTGIAIEYVAAAAG